MALRKDLRALAFSSLALGGAHALAQGLPPPPVSPAPVLRLEYDALGRPTRQVQAPGGANFSTVTGYDRLGRATTLTDARGQAVQLAYDGRENLLQVTDPRGLVTQYPRTGLGDATGLISPDTGAATHTVDAAGNLLSRTDSRGVTATYSYDALNRLRGLVYSQGGQSQAFSWEYDQTGPGFSHGIGRLTSARFPGGSARYAYDAQGRLTAHEQSVTHTSTVTLSVGYGYDTAGRLVRLTYPSGRVLEIPHVGGLPTGLHLAPGAGQAALALLGDLQFEPATPGQGDVGPLRSWSWQLAGGALPLPHVRAFDVYGRMVRHPLGGAVRDIRYDEADRVAGYTHLDAGTGQATAATRVLDQTFGYDEAGRLTRVDTGVGEWAYGYDATGNRTQGAYTPRGGAAQVRGYTVEPQSNRLLAVGAPQRVQVHDAAGHVTQSQEGTRGWTATIDLSGRISGMRVATAAGTVEVGYGHDHRGLRVWKRPVGGGGSGSGGGGGGGAEPPLPGKPNCVTQDSVLGPFTVCSADAGVAPPGVVYVHDGAGRLLGEYDGGTGQVLREYVWVRDLPVAVVDGSPGAPQVYYVQADHLNTPRVLLDRAGRQRWSWVAEPFGASAPIEDPLGYGAVKLHLRMPGQYFDEESGLSDNWHRTYDAGVGRYTQSDPIGLAGGINTYAYVNGAPTMYTDPMGLFLGPWHTSFSNVAMRDSGFGERVANRVAGFSTGADLIPGSQATWNAHWHAMCTINVPRSECQRRYEEYIEQQISTCTASGLGRAMHAAQDSAARGHAGWQYWGGGVPSREHLKGDSDPTDAEQATAIARSKLIIRRFKAKCPCTELGPYSG